MSSVSQCWRCRWEGWSVRVPGGSSPSPSKPSSALAPPPVYVEALTRSGSLTVTSAVAARPSTWGGLSSWSVQRKGSEAGAPKRVAWWRTAPLWPSSGGNTGALNWGASGGRTRGGAARQNPRTTTNTITGSKQNLSTSRLTCWLRKTLKPQRHLTYTRTQAARLHPPSRQLHLLWCALLRITDEKTKSTRRCKNYKIIQEDSLDIVQKEKIIFTVFPERLRRNRQHKHACLCDVQVLN